jgi:hypothetical protein
MLRYKTPNLNTLLFEQGDVFPASFQNTILNPEITGWPSLSYFLRYQISIISLANLGDKIDPFRAPTMGGSLGKHCQPSLHPLLA